MFFLQPDSSSVPWAVVRWNISGKRKKFQCYGNNQNLSILHKKQQPGDSSWKRSICAWAWKIHPKASRISLNYIPKRSWLGNRPVSVLAAAPATGAWEEAVVGQKESIPHCSNPNLSHFQLVPDRCLSVCLLGVNGSSYPGQVLFSSRVVFFSGKKKKKSFISE